MPLNGLVVIYPAAPCMSKMMTRNHLYDISLLVYYVQGSILGPFFSYIYVNDLSKSSSHFEFILFSDDINSFTMIEYTLPVGISKLMI